MSPWALPQNLPSNTWDTISRDPIPGYSQLAARAPIAERIQAIQEFETARRESPLNPDVSMFAPVESEEWLSK